jgi:hypothetical protein
MRSATVLHERIDAVEGLLGKLAGKLADEVPVERTYLQIVARRGFEPFLKKGKGIRS